MRNFVAKFMQKNKIEDSELEELKEKARKWDTQEWLKAWEETKAKSLKVGDRVKVKAGCFSAGALATVTYVQPDYNTIWVRRDQAGSDCFYYADELDKLES